jgi:hypothetical protein
MMASSTGTETDSLATGSLSPPGLRPPGFSKRITALDLLVLNVNDRRVAALYVVLPILIKLEYAKGGITNKQLAATYGVTQSTISLLLRGEIWPDVGGPLARPETEAEMIERFQSSLLKPLDPKRLLRDADARSIFDLRGDSEPGGGE